MSLIETLKISIYTPTLPTYIFETIVSEIHFSQTKTTFETKRNVIIRFMALPAFLLFQQYLLFGVTRQYHFDIVWPCWDPYELRRFFVLPPLDSRSPTKQVHHHCSGWGTTDAWSLEQALQIEMPSKLATRETTCLPWLHAARVPSRSG